MLKNNHSGNDGDQDGDMVVMIILLVVLMVKMTLGEGDEDDGNCGEDDHEDKDDSAGADGLGQHSVGNATWVGNFKLRKISKTQEDSLRKPDQS